MDEEFTRAVRAYVMEKLRRMAERMGRPELHFEQSIDLVLPDYMRVLKRAGVTDIQSMDAWILKEAAMKQKSRNAGEPSLVDQYIDHLAQQNDSRT